MKICEHLLEDVEWDLHPGAIATYGDWPVENREEFCLAAAARLPLVRQACESGKYNAIVLLGGGEPGFLESREIARKFNIPVTACAFSQMHIASMLGNRFSVIDLSELHNMYYYNLVVQHRFTERCASIRNVNFPLPRPGINVERSPRKEKAKALRGEHSEMVEAAVAEAVAAIEEDGAEVITFGCSATFWCSHSCSNVYVLWDGKFRCWKAMAVPSNWLSSWWTCKVDRQRPDFPERSSEEMAAQKDVLDPMCVSAWGLDALIGGSRQWPNIWSSLTGDTKVEGWRTFLRTLAPDIAAMDLFAVPTIGFSLLYAFVIVSRRIRTKISVEGKPEDAGSSARTPWGELKLRVAVDIVEKISMSGCPMLSRRADSVFPQSCSR